MPGPDRGPPHLGCFQDPLVLGLFLGSLRKLAGSKRGHPKPGCPSVLCLHHLRLYHLCLHLHLPTYPIAYLLSMF